jgi:hypothetical protein
MSNILCGNVKRNMSDEEWDIFAGDDLRKEITCADLPENNQK